MTLLDRCSPAMKHVTVTRMLAVVVLGCAALSVHIALQMRNKCMAVCTYETPVQKLDVHDLPHNTTLLPLMSSTTSHHDMNHLSSTSTDHRKNVSYRNVTKTVSSVIVDQTELKSTTVRMIARQPSSEFQIQLSADGKCNMPLFCSSKFVRNCITNDIIGRVPDALTSHQMKSPRSRSVETSHMRQQSFRKVFDSRAWGHSWDAQHRGLNASGVGATIHWTQETVATLHSVITQLKQLLGVKRIRLLDMPCGDMAWMSRFLQTRDDVDYTGVDIVPDIIHHHLQKFSGFGWHFVEWDVVRDGVEFPNASFDLILCRALLQHLYIADVLRTLAHFSSAPVKYRQRVFLLTSTFSRHSQNEELEINSDNPGRHRELNLELPPISLVPPLCLVRDGPPDAREPCRLFLGLWELPLHIVTHCIPPFATFTLRHSHLSVNSCVDWSLRPTKRSSRSRLLV